MALEDLVTGLFDQAGYDDLSVDPSMVVDRLMRKGLTEPRRATPARPRRSAPEFGADDEVIGDAPAPKAKSFDFGAGDDLVPDLPEVPLPRPRPAEAPAPLKGRPLTPGGYLTGPKPDVPDPTPVPEVGGFPAVQPLEDAGRFRDPAYGSQENMLTGDEAHAERAAKIAGAERGVAEAEDRLRVAKERAAATAGAPAARRGTPVDTTRLAIEAEVGNATEALAQAQAGLSAANRSTPPTMNKTRDAFSRMATAVGQMPLDVAGGLMRPVDAGLDAVGLPGGTGGAEALRRGSERVAKDNPVDPTRNEEFQAKLGQGAGSAIGFVVTGALGRAAGLPAAMVSATAGGAQNAEQYYREADQLGVPAYKKALAYIVGGAIGSSEGLGLGRIADQLDKTTGGGVRRYFGLIVKEMGEEGLQEGAQQLADNIAKFGLFGQDPGSLTKDVAENALIGALLGMGFAGTLGVPALARGREAGVPPPPAPAPLDPELTPSPPGGEGSPLAATIPPAEPVDGGVPPASAPIPVSLPDVAPAAPAAQAEDVPLAAAPPADRALLRGAGYTDEQIAAMGAAERAAELDQAREAGVAPEFGLDDEAVADGSRAAPVAAESAEDVDFAGQQVAEPTEAQKKAGNYRKGHLRWEGLDITIENPKGSIRSGTDAAGKAWQVEMPAAYGYVKRTTGKDGDQVDVFVGDNLASNTVYVVDQIDPKTGKFDEHKGMVGYDSEQAARDAYVRAYDGQAEQRIGGITPMGVDEFRDWARSGDTKKPLAGRPRAPSQPRAGRPLSLLEFVASRGGLRPDGDLAALGLTGGHRVNVLGMRGRYPVVRARGQGLDRMREAAQEAGYFPAEDPNRPSINTVTDFLDALDGELRGQRRFAQGAEETDIVRSETERATEENAAREEDLQGYRDQIAEALRAAGVPVEAVHQEDVSRAAEIMADEGLSAEDAFERAAIRNAMDDDLVNDQEISETYGEGAADAVQPGPALEDGAALGVEGGGPEAGQLVQGARPDGEAEGGPSATPGSSEGAGRAPGLSFGQQDEVVDEAATEQTPAGEQIVIPGAEPIGQGEQAQRGADKPLKPKAEQRPADEGLFGDESRQTDLVDLTRQPARPREKTAKTADIESIGSVAAEVRALGSPLDIAMRWASEPDATHAAIDSAVVGVRRAEKQLLEKYDARSVSDLDDAPLSSEEREFLFTGLSPTDVGQLRALSRQLQPVDDLAEASSEIAHELKRLPADPANMSFDDQLAVMRLQVLFSEVERLGGDLGEIIKRAGTRYAARFGDPDDAGFMAGDAAERLRRLFGGQESSAPPARPMLPPPSSSRTPSLDRETAPATGVQRKKTPELAKATGQKPIEDFGEKIEGARKDTFAGFRDALNEDIDVAVEPLSKSFPQPNYEKLAESGVEKRVLATIAVMRDMIPTRPKKSYKLKQWVADVEMLRSFAAKMLSGDIDVARFEALAKGKYALQDIPLTAEAIEDVVPTDLSKAAKYRVKSGSYSMLNGQRYSPAKTFWFLEGDSRRVLRNPLTNDPANPYTYRETPEEAVSIAKKIIALELKPSEAGASPERAKYTDVGIYRDRSKGEVFLGFKVRSTVIRLKAGFEAPAAAREYLKENRDEIQKIIDDMRQGPNMRGSENQPRTGASLRDGDVTPEVFSQTFGFRGVQFGNYVEGGRRQEDLNRAFDALMDLADVLDIPTRALSLDGQLGLAFGARGHGGRDAAAAHYEPTQVVINLTKGGGPGSLAHEWLHALDNYFARQDDASGFMSERKRDAGPVRDEVYQAWKGVESTLMTGGFAMRSLEFDKPRSKPYWSTTIEKAARAFERYIVDRLSERGAVNDYLANIDTSGGAYPTSDEMGSQGIRAAFDRLFDTIETRETEKGVALFSVGIPQRRRQGIPAEAREPLSTFKNDSGIKAHADYTAAKAGSVAAAANLVRDLVTAENLAEARRRFGADAIYAPIVAEEASGRNKIPAALAEYYAAKTGTEAARGLYQANRAYHTGASPMERLIARTAFTGDVQRGGRYVIVDDVSVMGSTIADMADYIQRNGGAVVGVVTLVNAGRTGVLTSTKKQISEIERRYGDEIRATFSVDPASLTGDEATYILNFRDADAIRTAAVAAGRRRGERLSAKGVPPPEGLSLVRSDSGALPGAVFDSRTNLTPFARQRRADLEHYLGAVVEKLVGPGFEVRFSDTIPIRAAQGWGSIGEGKVTAAGTYTPAERLIKLALADPTYGSPLTTAFHESFHAIEDRLLTAPELELMQRETPRLRRIIKEAYGFTQAEVDGMAGYEVRAVAFEAYAQERMRGGTGTGFHIGVRAVFERLARLLSAIRHALAGLGFQTSEDIFTAAYRGDMASRTITRRFADGVQASVRTPRLPARGFNVLPEKVADAWAQPAPLRQRLSAAIDAALLSPARQLHDKHISMLWMQRSVEAATSAATPETLDMHLAATLYANRVGGRMDRAVKDLFNPLFDDMTKRRISKADLHDYLYARHAIERNQVVGKLHEPGSQFHTAMTDDTIVGASGVSNAWAKQVLSDAQTRASDFDALAAMVDKITVFNREAMKEAGLESDKALLGWQTTYRHYVPLKGFEGGDEESLLSGAGKGFNVRGLESQRALGRSSRADDILANLLDQTQRTIVRAEKNTVGKTVLRFVQANPHPDLYEIGLSEVRRDVNDQTGLIEEKIVVTSADATRTFAVKVGGKPYFIRFKHDGLLDAVKSIDAPRIPALLRGVAWATRQFSAFQTARNPEFFITNAIRDVQDAVVTLNAEQKKRLTRKFMKIYGSGKALRAAVLGQMDRASSPLGMLYREWVESGGKVSAYGFKDFEAIRAEIDRDLKQRAEPRALRAAKFPIRLFNPINGPAIKAIEAASETLESMTRFAAYAAARNVGLSKAHAARMALNSTVNFSMKGRSTPWFQAFYAFINAAIQGTVKTFKLLRNSRRFRHVAAGMATGGLVQALWGLASSPDDDDKKKGYEGVPYWEKERNIIIWLPGQKSPYKLPMAYTIMPFWVFGEQLGMLISGKVSPAEAAANVLSTAATAWNPVNEEGPPLSLLTWLKTISPTVTDPLIELVTNRNWLQRPIHPDRSRHNEDQPASELHKLLTNPVFVQAAQRLNRMTGGNAFEAGKVDLYPDQIEYGWNFLFGGFGRFMGNTWGYTQDKVAGVDTPVERVPFVRRFVGRGIDSRTAESEKFYEEMRKVDLDTARVRRAAKVRREGGSGAGEAAEVERRLGSQIHARPGERLNSIVSDADRAFEVAQSELKKLRADEQKIRNDNALGRAARSAEIEAIRVRQREVMGRARQAYQRMKKAREPASP